jgi:hypothetical protein
MSALPARAGGDMPVEKLLSRLDGVKGTGPDRWVAKCPAHEDRRPSLSVRALDDGRILVHCWSGCSAAEVVHAAGLTLVDLYPPRPDDHHRGPLPKRSRWHRDDAWALVAHEAAVAAVVASDAAAGREISTTDAERAWQAADRLADAARTVGACR